MSVIQILGNTDRSEVDRKMDQYHTENLAEQRKLAKEHQDKMDKIRRQNSEILRKMESMRTHIDNTQAGGGPDLPVIQHMQAGGAVTQKEKYSGPKTLTAILSASCAIPCLFPCGAVWLLGGCQLLDERVVTPYCTECSKYCAPSMNPGNDASMETSCCGAQDKRAMGLQKCCNCQNKDLVSSYGPVAAKAHLKTPCPSCQESAPSNLTDQEARELQKAHDDKVEADAKRAHESAMARPPATRAGFAAAALQAAAARR